MSLFLSASFCVSVFVFLVVCLCLTIPPLTPCCEQAPALGGQAVALGGHAPALVLGGQAAALGGQAVLGGQTAALGGQAATASPTRSTPAQPVHHGGRLTTVQYSAAQSYPAAAAPGRAQADTSSADSDFQDPFKDAASKSAGGERWLRVEAPE